LRPAEYRVQKLDAEFAVVLISCRGKRISHVPCRMQPTAKETQTQSKLIFKTLENRYFLSQVGPQGIFAEGELFEVTVQKKRSRSRAPRDDWLKCC